VVRFTHSHNCRSEHERGRCWLDLRRICGASARRTRRICTAHLRRIRTACWLLWGWRQGRHGQKAPTRRGGRCWLQRKFAHNRDTHTHTHAHTQACAHTDLHTLLSQFSTHTPAQERHQALQRLWRLKPARAPHVRLLLLVSWQLTPCVAAEQWLQCSVHCVAPPALGRAARVVVHSIRQPPLWAGQQGLWCTPSGSPALCGSDAGPWCKVRRGGFHRKGNWITCTLVRSTLHAVGSCMRAKAHAPGKKWTVGMTLPSLISSRRTLKYSSALRAWGWASMIERKSACVCRL